MLENQKQHALSRCTVLATSALAVVGVRAPSAVVINVASYPLVDEIARAALPLWHKPYPEVEVKIQTRQYHDHNTTTTRP